MTARMRRLASDYEQVKKYFSGHKNIIVTPVGDDIPEQYKVTYFVNGIYLLPDGRIETLARHEIEITLHAEYPRYKPICKIMTPIWHPNFRDGQICIGDIWGAGESLSDIIINIGDMIQYKSWNSYSPLSADAAQWAMENKHLFPVGNIDLYVADYASAKETVEIDLFDDDGAKVEEAKENTATPAEETKETENVVATNQEANDGNDFDITAEELEGIEFVPTAQRMQSVSHGGTVKGQKINFKTILVKGLIWAFIGAFLGFGVSEIADNTFATNADIARMTGSEDLAEYYECEELKDEAWKDVDRYYQAYCKENNLDPDDSSNITSWMSSNLTDAEQTAIDEYLNYSEQSEQALYQVYLETDGDEDELSAMLSRVTRTGTAVWAAFIAVFIGLFLGIGEGIFYGSKEQALKYAGIGASVSAVIGYISGYLAQYMYSEMLQDDATDLSAAFVRALGWALMGLGIGIAIGLIKPEQKRILFCAIGGTTGAFIGGFLFNYICDIIPNDIVARAAAIIIMGSLIGVGVGLLEQFAKQAWLKVIRGEFEGKEYLVFAGTTSIGNNGKNTIVLFKDKLVGPHHCDIRLEGNKYVLVDCGTPMGTVVNGNKTARHVLRHGDTIAIGNSVLVFNTK